MKKGVLLLSGGMDSTTLLYDLVSQGNSVFPISINYGQKHSREVDAARETCNKLKVPLRIFSFPKFGLIAPSALTDNRQGIPEGFYTEESMKQTVVPNRNMVLLSLATSYAIGLGVDYVWYAAHGGDHTIYPDCRPEFVEAMKRVLEVCDWKKIILEVPYLHWDKAKILQRGFELGVDYSLTWTCYKGDELACGKCGSCTERLEAFRILGRRDPLGYK